VQDESDVKETVCRVPEKLRTDTDIAARTITYLACLGAVGQSSRIAQQTKIV
jgi:hypothetical protein